MNIKWFKYLKEDQSKEDLEKKVLASREVLDILKEILQKDLEVSQKKKTRTAHYMMPAWSEYQADKIGTERTLQQVIDLLPKD